MLNKQQQEHLNLILEYFNENYPKKYTAGAIEHDGFLGDLTPMELAYNLLEEAMDSVAYALTLIESLRYHEE